MLVFISLINLAIAHDSTNCSKDLLAQATESFPNNSCHLGMQEPGAYAIFCNQKVDNKLTEQEIPVFIGIDSYRFKTIPDADKPRVWGYIAYEFMQISDYDLVEIIKSESDCTGINTTWWEVETHLPLQDYTRKETNAKRAL
jgi:glycosyltransferase A (GT-A) superfamily protein (DUF2064 family)